MQLHSQSSQEAPITRLTSEHGIETRVTEGEIAVKFPQAFRIARLSLLFTYHPQQQCHYTSWQQERVGSMLFKCDFTDPVL